jgi:prepilin-type processing-associated H-X9-DG protein
MRTSKPRRLRARLHAFTLIEVLLVIGIIAALIAILLPMLSAARRQAALVTCASNLRQVAATCLLHAHDHQGYAPLAGDLQGYPLAFQDDQFVLGDAAARRYTYWIGDHRPVASFEKSVIRYWTDADELKISSSSFRLPALRPFRCPVFDSMGTDRFYGRMSIETEPPSGHFWSSYGDYVVNEGFTGFRTTAPDDVRRLRGHLSRVRASGSTVLIADGQPRLDYWTVWTPTDPAGTVTLGDAWLDRTRTPTRTASKDNFDLRRHRGKMNVAFLDGHVETLLMNANDLGGAVLIK